MIARQIDAHTGRGGGRLRSVWEAVGCWGRFAAKPGLPLAPLCQLPPPPPPAASQLPSWSVLALSVSVSPSLSLSFPSSIPPSPASNPTHMFKKQLVVCIKTLEVVSTCISKWNKLLRSYSHVSSLKPCVPVNIELFKVKMKMLCHSRY